MEMCGEYDGYARESITYEICLKIGNFYFDVGRGFNVDELSMKTEENDPHLFVSRQSKAWAEFRRRLAESGVSAGQKVLGKAIGRMLVRGVRTSRQGEKGEAKRNPGRSSNVPGNFDGAPGRIRTHDPLVRSQVLYPTELLAHS